MRDAHSGLATDAVDVRLGGVEVELPGEDRELDEEPLLVGLEQVVQAVSDAEADLGNEGRVLLRPSGTEPLIRVMVEGTRSEQVERLSRQIADVVAASVG